MADVQARDDTDVVNPGDPIRVQGTYTGGYPDSGSQSTDIGSLVGPDNKSVAGLVGAAREKRRADIGITGEADKRLAADQARVDQAFAAEGHSAAEQLKPWDANKEHAKFEEDPISAFGSVGGLFAMVASAFTKAPMENAINGMAGAINAKKQGNEEAYQRAFDSYKENAKLAQERFKTQHELYSDALGLMDHDQAAATAKLNNAAIRFGDDKAIMLAQAGYFPELYELLNSRATSMEHAAKADAAITENTINKAAVNAIKLNPPNTGDPVQDKMHIAAQVHQVYAGGKETGTAEQEAVGRYFRENANKPTPEFIDGLAAVHEKFTPKGVNIEGYRSWLANYVQTHDGKYPPAEEDASMQQKYGLTPGLRGGAAGGGTSTQARKTEAIKEIQSKNPGMSLAEAEREFNKTVQIPSAHDVFQSDIQYDKVERIKDGVNKVEDLLAKHKFITGVGGTLTRPVEVIGNILGSNETDRKQFERDVLEIKELGQSALFDRSGRPLSSEAADAGKIFAGLKAGDTTANTLRAYLELRPVLDKIQTQIKARGAGKGPVSGGGETPTTSETPTGKDAPWLNDPVKP